MSRAVFGVPIYNGARHLPEALESLLGQTERDLVVACVDDCSSDESARIVASFARRDPRIHLRVNECRLGLAANWRRAFEYAREIAPEAEYFAWGSDHDVWHPRWLEVLSRHLDGLGEAVSAYPLSLRIAKDGYVIQEPAHFETAGVDDWRTRVALTASSAPAGDIVYGLHRADRLEAAGVFRDVIGADRLVLTELAARGRFVQAPEILWYRRFAKEVTKAAQRASLFGPRAPVHTWLPWWLVHGAVVAWTFARAPEVRGGPVDALALGIRIAYVSGARRARKRAKPYLLTLKRRRRLAQKRAKPYRRALKRRWRSAKRRAHKVRERGPVGLARRALGRGIAVAVSVKNRLIPPSDAQR